MQSNPEKQHQATTLSYPGYFPVSHNTVMPDVMELVEQWHESDGEVIRYVCTTSLQRSDVAVDIFYRDTPHPQHGNYYFGLFIDPFSASAMICNADGVEGIDLAMISCDNTFYYSRARHDCITVEDGNGQSKMIDGGRSYIRATGKVWMLRVDQGNLVELY